MTNISNPKNFPDSSAFVSRSAFRFFSGTLLSRVSGMFRDVIMAFFFGTSASLAAFLLAYRFVYLLRRVFAEGVLHQGFIPHFETVRANDPRKGALFFRDLFWSMAILVGAILVVGSLGLLCFSGEIPKLMLSMLPGIFFICLFGLSTGLLQAEKSFFIPSVAPVGFNAIWILGILAFRGMSMDKAAEGLALIISFAFFVQWGITLPRMWKYLRQYLSVKEMFRGKVFSEELRTLVQPLLLGMVGVAAMQVNSAVDGVFARWADLEGPAYLWYAIRLQQLPLALFALALSSALLPSLSRAYEAQDESRFQALMTFVKKRAFTLIFPCMIGIFVLGAASMNFLFGRGDFTELSTLRSTICLWCYGIGLLPAAFILIYAPSFYAKKDYKTPMIGFVGASLLNICLNGLLVFAFDLGAASVALATSITAYLNALYLSYKAGQKTKSLVSMAKVGFCSVVAGIVALLIGAMMGDATLDIWRGRLAFSRNLSSQFLQLLIPTIAYFGTFFGLSKLVKSEDVLSLKSTSYRSEI